jgi:hypothetical protein
MLDRRDSIKVDHARRLDAQDYRLLALWAAILLLEG